MRPMQAIDLYDTGIKLGVEECRNKENREWTLDVMRERADGPCLAPPNPGTRHPRIGDACLGVRERWLAGAGTFSVFFRPSRISVMRIVMVSHERPIIKAEQVEAEQGASLITSGRGPRRNPRIQACRFFSHENIEAVLGWWIWMILKQLGSTRYAGLVVAADDAFLVFFIPDRNLQNGFLWGAVLSNQAPLAPAF
ncbi:hypothetical protein PG993_004377 [Apiospora rasikravindrae]|uniref:Uncharacterized protein n=1 Tax=Apiospora rasikravindrae TaxID=990691 RepID=A0ABR1TCK4_9PEZI